MNTSTPTQYAPKHFRAEELVPPSIYHRRGAAALELIDVRVLVTLDQLRDKFGPCTVNNWSFGGPFTQRGLRTSASEHYSPTSQHTFGRAMDCSFRNATAAEVRAYVLEHPSRFPHITFIEDDVSWFHFDCRNGPRITVWSPITKRSYLS